MDYLKDDWPPKLIQDWFNLTDKQMADVMEYIENNRAQVEAEYAQVPKRAEDLRKYWEERNLERFEQIAKSSPKPGAEEIQAKLEAWKTMSERRVITL
jgi:hypothetical protein